MAAPEETTIMSDAMKMFSPCPLKPDSLETRRILAVLDETMAKLELSSLIPRVVDSLDRFAGVLGPELTDSLMEHQQLSSDLEQLLTSSGDGDTGAAEERWGSLCVLEQHLKRSVRNILRLLLADPSLCRALKDEAWTRESPAEEFLKAFGEFRGFMLERLLTSPVEEEERARLLAGISLQVKNNTEAIAALRAELAAATRAREEE
ncbi:PREDICTED: IQ domain-containing protein D, partial [Buceros rhinoceros silvestris]|uniref:IQ domain-containing protein D n=1 Tax=Buceros rhinoceros silvestris TaxID=175836 RepID=UPI000528353C